MYHLHFTVAALILRIQVINPPLISLISNCCCKIFRVRCGEEDEDREAKCYAIPQPLFKI